MKNKNFSWVFGVICVLGVVMVTVSARALSIAPDSSFLINSSYSGSNDALMYGFTRSTEMGDYAPAYARSLSTSSAQMKWVGGQVMGPQKLRALVKTEQGTENELDISWWDRKSALTFAFQRIKSVEIYGDGNSVPDGGMTITLLGLGLVGCGVALRLTRNRHTAG